MLREHGGGVARGSMHLDGRAIDVRLTDKSSALLRDAAIELQRGGVGYYRISDFVLRRHRPHPPLVAPAR